jgi:hypothetical protein
MHWYIGYGYRDWQMIYFLVAVLAGFYYIHHFGVPADTWIKYKATLVSIAWALPVYLLAKRRPKKFERHPSIEQYKTDFEEFIRKKEKELLSERY